MTLWIANGVAFLEEVVSVAPRPFIPVPDCVEVEIRFRFGGVVMCNRWYYYRDPFFHSPSTNLAFAGEVGTAVINSYLPIIANNVLFDRVRVRDATSATAPWSTIDYTGYFGTFPSEALAANCTCFVRFDRRRRAGIKKGALCVPAPPRGAVVENTFTEEYIELIHDFLGDLDNPGFSVGYALGWVSFRHNNAWRSEGVFYYKATSDPVATVAPRRRRLRNVNVLP